MSKKGSGLLRLGIGCSVLAVPLGAMALPFEYGEFKGSLDSTVSVGATVRTQSQDKSLVGIANGGTSRSVNDDDGNLGFDKGDLVSGVLKATHDLEIKWHDYGVFTRVNYFYDAVAADASKREDRFNANGIATAARKKNDYELGQRGRERLESEIDVLDLFAYGNFDLAGHNLSARVGKQVVSWGESTFIGNSINSINPIDVAKIRTPGAEIKEALIPTAMLWTSLQLTDQLSLEGVWLAAYEKTLIDPRGSFFSTSDIASDDGDKAIVSFGRREDDNLPARDPRTTASNPGSASVWVTRDRDAKVDDASKQFGLALRYYSEALADTEFAAYYLTYHSRTPLLSGVRGGTGPGGNTTNVLNSTALPTCSASPSNASCRASYFAEYPGNIDLFGLSFNSTAPLGVAVQGEYSYRPNQPIQISGTEVILAILGVPNTVTGQGFTNVDTDNDPQTAPVPVANAALVPRGTVIRGYERVDMHQVQSTFTKAFGPTIGAEQFVLLGEVGLTYLDLPSNQVFSGPGAGLPAPGSGGPLPPVLAEGAASNGSIQREGFADKTSWGYRMVSRLDFENVIGSASLSPRLVWAHDVHGVGPSFNQGTKAITLGLAMNYLQRWQADVGYTTFFGGRTYSGTDPIPPGTPLSATAVAAGDSSQSANFATSANPNKDRDFLAVSVSYAF